VCWPLVELPTHTPTQSHYKEQNPTLDQAKGPPSPANRARCGRLRVWHLHTEALPPWCDVHHLHSTKLPAVPRHLQNAPTVGSSAESGAGALHDRIVWVDEAACVAHTPCTSMLKPTGTRTREMGQTEQHRALVKFRSPSRGFGALAASRAGHTWGRHKETKSSRL
jgi:hypothetical protein